MRAVQEEPGASDKAIQNLPQRSFDPGSGNNNDKDAPTCAICCAEYQFGDELRILPCKHEFHVACVDQWLKLKRACPLCRHDITQPMAANANANAPHSSSEAVVDPNDQV